MSRLVSIDPGVEGGYALWDSPQKVDAPASTGVWSPSKNFDWQNRVVEVMNFLERLSGIGPSWDNIVCEWPFYHETQGGREVAASGSLVKLSVFAGCILEFARQREIGCMFIEVNKWKGQMSKVAVQHRIRKRLGEKACKSFRSHAWDAVGIGLYSLGRF